ncbi:MAG TPA: LysM peptidoglycan-binding domain-containing protein [Steroidobacteraceae bacterium]|nr:LysM peptidoglycan-binding domain-containing protein [Steroidobacteraceae bacterium]
MSPTGPIAGAAQARRGRAPGRIGLSALAFALAGALALAVPRGALGTIAATAAGPAQAAGAQNAFPRPPSLEPAVHFWIRVYTEIDTNSGFLHDDENLSVVYETLHFGPNSSPRERERRVAEARDRYVAALKRIAGAQGPLAPEDQRVRELWGEQGTPARLLEATDHVRFQLGQSDRFRAGLERSGQWEAHIAETLAKLGLPPQLAVLPHVESSFNPAAHSKAGAAGLWQFMRSTGRRYMRIDATVDDRLDPFQSTEAAAQLLSYNYRLLGTWPLAITAYNHGAAGMRRAVETLGTEDIATIIRDYRSPSFGFASRNFYASFLAALEVDQNTEKYFGPLPRAPEARFEEIALPIRASVSALERAFGIGRDTLRELNPALRAVCWRGVRPVPRGYHLRLPLGDTHWTRELVAQRLGLGGAPGALLASNSVSGNGLAGDVISGNGLAGAAAVAAPAASDRVSSRHRVRRGETLASLAEEYGTSAASLAQLNGLSPTARLRRGHYIRVPGEPQVVKVAALEAIPVTAARIAAASPDEPAEEPSGTSSASTPIDAGIYVVQSGDSLPDIAMKVGLSESELLALNHMRDPDFIFEGQRLRIAAGAFGTAQSGPAARGSVPTEVAELESEEDAEAVASVVKPAALSQPVSADEEEALGPGLGPAAVEVTATADPTDYSIAKDDTIIVAAAETLGHYADWLEIPASRLRSVNHMRYGRPVVIGHRVKLDFRKVSQEEFAAKRREYHRTLEASYFAAHRIAGTETYLARRGDSLWNLTLRYEHLPIWLLQQYNPDVDFSAMRPGTQIVVPRVEDLSAGS